VLDHYGVGFRVMHGFTSATCVNDVAEDDDGRELIALYVGDYDPSGMNMSEHDLPERLSRYDGDHVVPIRIALTKEQTAALPSFPASDKRTDSRYKWFVKNYGDWCWELDALSPNVLRDRLERAIVAELDREAWDRATLGQELERDLIIETCETWRSISGQDPK